MNPFKPCLPHAHEKHYVPPDLIPDWSMDHVEWIEVMGPSGPYERADLNINHKNSEFQYMLEDLSAQGNKMIHQGYFLWKFTNNLIVGRKKHKSGTL